MEVQTAIYCRGKLIEVLEKRVVSSTDTLTIGSKAGGGSVDIKIDGAPTGVDTIEVRINVLDEAIFNKDMIPPTASRMRKLDFSEEK